MTWWAVYSDIAQMPKGVTVRCPVMINDLDSKFGSIARVRVQHIKVKIQSGYEPWLDEF